MPRHYQPDNHPKNPRYLKSLPTTEQIDSVKRAIYDLSKILNDLDEYYDIYGSYPSKIKLDNPNNYDDE